MLMIESNLLTKKFGKFVAVDGLTLAVERDEVFGLLGPNGAGKDVANPRGAMLCAGSMLRHLGMRGEAERIERAVRAALATGFRTRAWAGAAALPHIPTQWWRG